MEEDQVSASLHTLKKRLKSFYDLRNEPAVGIEFEKVAKLSAEKFVAWGEALKTKAIEIHSLFNALAGERNPDIINPNIKAPMDTNNYYHVARRGFYTDCREIECVFAAHDKPITLIQLEPLAA